MTKWPSRSRFITHVRSYEQPRAKRRKRRADKGVPRGTKPALCSKCGRDLLALVPEEATGVTCFECDNPPPRGRL